MPVDVLIEGLLFYKATPLEKKNIQTLLAIDEESFVRGVKVLHERLQGGGIRLVETETQLQLTTAPELADTIESIRKEELKADIGKAGAETLAIVLYREPITRAEIDRIRGVNSSFILRNLMVRGLVERVTVPKKSGQAYAITPALLAQLGVTNKQSLPNFSTVLSAIERFEAEISATES